MTPLSPPTRSTGRRLLSGLLALQIALSSLLTPAGAQAQVRLPALGEETLLHIESQWSESAGLRLYGFGTREDRRAFVLLQAIQGDRKSVV